MVVVVSVSPGNPEEELVSVVVVITLFTFFVPTFLTPDMTN